MNEDEILNCLSRFSNNIYIILDDIPYFMTLLEISKNHENLKFIKKEDIDNPDAQPISLEQIPEIEKQLKEELKARLASCPDKIKEMKYNKDFIVKLKLVVDAMHDYFIQDEKFLSIVGELDDL